MCIKLGYSVERIARGEPHVFVSADTRQKASFVNSLGAKRKTLRVITNHEHRESSYLRAYKALSRPGNEYPVAVTLLVSFIVFRLRLKRRFTLNATDTSCASV